MLPPGGVHGSGKRDMHENAKENAPVSAKKDVQLPQKGGIIRAGAE